MIAHLFHLFLALNPFLIVGLVLIFLLLFYWAFIFTMACYRAYLTGRLKITSKILVSPIILLAGLMDVFCNSTLAWIFFLERPHEWFLTQRFERYTATGPSIGYKYYVAKYICDNYLDIFDPSGNHCNDLTPSQAQQNQTEVIPES